MGMRTVLGLAVVLAVAHAYLPGISPHDYSKGDVVDLKVNKLTSVKTQLPYDFYDALPFCRPKKIDDVKENLGEILRGDRIANSLYRLNMAQNKPCQVLGADLEKGTIADNLERCELKYTKRDLGKFSKFVKNDHRVHWVLDNMPVAQPRSPTQTAGKEDYHIGFSLGNKEGSNFVLNNHVRITVRYHADKAYGQVPNQEGYRVVGFEVEPSSRDYGSLENAQKCQAAGSLKVGPTATEEKVVFWTYEVNWVVDSTLWADRWDRYFVSVDSQIHWFSIINSLMIVLFLTGMVAMIMMRTLHADLRQYSQQIEANEEIEETGWKLVHGDVFRPPRHPMLLSVLVGFGHQLFVMFVITMIFAVLGFLAPANRGGLVTAMILLVSFSGVFAGYSSTRLYKFLKGVHWKKNTMMTAFLVPGIVFGVFMVLDFFIMGARSSGSVPFTTLLVIMSLWFCISLPLVFFGSYLAFRKPAISAPVGTNQIPRQIPDQVWYMSPTLSVLMGGILPFGAVFIELYFILSAVWGHQMYYIFGFLFIVFLILVITCAEISIVMTYFQLCSEDYHWWWRSFLTSAASAFYMFLYSVFYFATKLTIRSFVSGLLYFGYTFIFTVMFFCVTGYIGFWSTFYFVRKIYAAVPFD
eukprot:m51a1_g13835 putative transmembrane 9 superfamily member 4-like (637) ;mRNA; r:508119-510590